MIPPTRRDADLNAVLLQKRAREIAKTYAAKRKRERKQLQKPPPIYRRTPR